MYSSAGLRKKKVDQQVETTDEEDLAGRSFVISSPILVDSVGVKTVFCCGNSLFVVE